MYQKYLSIFSVLLLFTVAGFLFYNWNNILSVFYSINLYWAVAGFGFYVISYVFRGIRLRILSNSQINFFGEAFNYSILHGFLSYLLPLRTGDVSLPFLLKATGKINLKKSVGILVKLRIIDLTMVGIFTIFGSFLGARMISSTIQTLWFLSGILLAFLWFGFQKIGGLGNYLLKNRFDYEFDISTLLKFTYKEFFFTFFVWITVYTSQYCMIRSIGLDFQFSEVIFLSAIQFPLQMLPVQGLANSGNHEGGWVSSLVLMGFSVQDSLKYAIASHGVLIIYVALLGLLAIIIGNRTLFSFFKKPVIKS